MPSVWHLPGRFFLTLFFFGWRSQHFSRNFSLYTWFRTSCGSQNMFFIDQFDLIWDYISLFRGNLFLLNVVGKYPVCCPGLHTSTDCLIIIHPPKTPFWAAHLSGDWFYGPVRIIWPALCSLHGSPLDFQSNSCQWVFRAFHYCYFN